MSAEASSAVTGSSLVEPMVQSLADRGYAIVPAFLRPAAVTALAEAARARESRGEFRPAAIGAGAHRAVRPRIRGDRIHWLSEPLLPPEREALAALEALRQRLNEDCALGLVDLECHYAVYPPGAGYVRHLDRSPAGAERVVSVVLYLNDGWGDSDGGELVLHVEPVLEVLPRGGTLAVFASERIEHEVRPAGRSRLSLAGWFRRRGRLYGGAPA